MKIFGRKDPLWVYLAILALSLGIIGIGTWVKNGGGLW